MIIHAEGFEVGNVADLAYKGLNAVGTSTKAITTGRNSLTGFRNTYVYNGPVGQASAYYTGGGYDATLRWPTNGIIVGFAFRLNSPWNRNQLVPLMGMFGSSVDPTNGQYSISSGGTTNLYIAQNGQLYVAINGSSSAIFSVTTGNFQAVADTWYYVEMSLTQNIGGSSCTAVIRVNGSQVGTSTFANSASAGFAINTVRLGYGGFATSNIASTTSYNNTTVMPQAYTSTFSVDFDDWYVLDTTRQPRGTFLGPVVIKALRPTSDVVTGMVRNTGSSNYSAVADSSFDSDSTYVTASNVGDTDVYGVTTLTGTGAVYGVVMTAAVKQISGAGRFAGIARLSGVNYLTEGRTTPTAAGYTANRFYMETVPNAGQADWDVTTVNNTGFGLTYEVQN